MALIKNLPTKSSLSHSSVFRFLLVGGTSTLFDFILYMALSPHVSVTIAKSVSMLLASLFSYALNKQFTFKDKTPSNFSHLLRFYIVFLANITVNVAINSILFAFTTRKIFSYIIATLLGMTVNYFGQRYFVFKMF